MANKITCRLCLGTNGKMINMFDPRLMNSEQLRKCVLLSTGVEIARNDVVTKYICQNCSDATISFYKFRCTALANDRALKLLANQSVAPHPSAEAVIEANRKVALELDEISTDISVVKVVEETSTGTASRATPATETLAVHPSVTKLIRNYPKLKIPNDLLKCNVQPEVVLEPKETKEDIKSSEGIPDIEKFKIMCPGIHIVKISEGGTEEETADGGRKRQPSEPLDINVSREVCEGHKRKPSESTPDICVSDHGRKDILPEVSNKVRPVSVLSNASSTSSKRNHSSSKSKKSVLLAERDLVQDIRSKTTIERCASVDTQLLLPSTIEEEEEVITRRVTRTRQKRSSHLRLALASDSDYEDDAIIYRPRRTRKRRRLLSSDSENSLYVPDEDEYLQQAIEDSLLDTVGEEPFLSCDICNRTFKTMQNLSFHRRIHPTCSVCNVPFKSDEVLRYHEHEICFKRVIENPPMLQLVRVDDQPDILARYTEAFEVRYEDHAGDNNDENDDDVIIVEDNLPAPVKDLDISTQNSSEYNYICQIFKKYRNMAHNELPNKLTETRPRIFVKYNSKGQIVLESMYSELFTFRVPVELVAKSTSFAYVSFSRKSPPARDFYCWANENVTGLRQRNNFLSMLLQQPVPNCNQGATYVKPAQTHQNVRILPKPALSVSQSALNQIAFPVQSNSHGGIVLMTDSDLHLPSTSASPPKCHLRPKPPSSSIQVNKTNVVVKTPLNTHIATSSTPTNTANTIVNTPSESVRPSTSNVTGKTCLRIKTPSELNAFFK